MERKFALRIRQIYSKSKFLSKKIIDEVIMENRSVCSQQDLDDENNKFKLKQFEFLYSLFPYFYFCHNNQYVYLITCGMLFLKKWTMGVI